MSGSTLQNRSSPHQQYSVEELDRIYQHDQFLVLEELFLFPLFPNHEEFISVEDNISEISTHCRPKGLLLPERETFSIERQKETFSFMVTSGGHDNKKITRKLAGRKPLSSFFLRKIYLNKHQQFTSLYIRTAMRTLTREREEFLHSTLKPLILTIVCYFWC